ncbi:hypothetical protein NDU88_001154 [Pleurodeles waltl]|uniref:Uncharacterized protein n=1 Tax=Pleurodeles waltl TaxID=8319 RepID=A0AAV7NEW2_PLEWA|nr:hypothetical protein NDU88_001154 [Pleurodeles waltl]
MQHMFWCCPAVDDMWISDLEALMEVSGFADLCTGEGSILGLFKHSSTAIAMNCFIDLALLTVRRLITTTWKAQVLPDVRHWCAATMKWGRAEAVARRHKEIQSLRSLSTAGDWDTLLQARDTYYKGLAD